MEIQITTTKQFNYQQQHKKCPKAENYIVNTFQYVVPHKVVNSDLCSAANKEDIKKCNGMYKKQMSVHQNFVIS